MSKNNLRVLMEGLMKYFLSEEKRLKTKLFPGGKNLLICSKNLSGAAKMSGLNKNYSNFSREGTNFKITSFKILKLRVVFLS